MPKPKILVMRRTTTKAATAIMRPIKPLIRRVVAAATFLASPELIMKSQPAIIRLAKKIRPMMMKTKLIISRPFPLRRPEILTLVRFGAGFILTDFPDGSIIVGLRRLEIFTEELTIGVGLAAKT